jgi:hypothetical protein
MQPQDTVYALPAHNVDAGFEEHHPASYKLAGWYLLKDPLYPVGLPVTPSSQTPNLWSDLDAAYSLKPAA